MNPLVTFLVVVVIFIIVIYVLSLTKPQIKNNLQTCRQSPDCGVGEICAKSPNQSTGYCVVPTCSTSTDCSTPAPSPNCPIGSQCVDQNCQPTSCTDSSQCPQGSVCANGQCLPLGETCNKNCYNGSLHCVDKKCVQCSYNGDCTSEQYCDAGACTYPPVTTCTTSADCANNPGAKVCETTAGVCVQCNGTSDCASGESCNNHVCTKGTPSFTCKSTTDCQNGEICDNGTCLPPAGPCSSGCNNMQVCIDNYCVPKPCKSETDCPIGATCNQGFCDTCSSTSQCPTQVINGTTYYEACVSIGSNPTCTYCAPNQPCGTGFTCDTTTSLCKKD